MPEKQRYWWSHFSKPAIPIAVHDRKTGRSFARHYTSSDANALVKWLNQRDAGYP